MVRHRGCAASRAPAPATTSNSRPSEPNTIPAIAGNAPMTPARAAAFMTAILLGPGVMAPTPTTVATAASTSVGIARGLQIRPVGLGLMPHGAIIPRLAGLPFAAYG